MTCSKKKRLSTRLQAYNVIVMQLTKSFEVFGDEKRVLLFRPLLPRAGAGDGIHETVYCHYFLRSLNLI